MKKRVSLTILSLIFISLFSMGVSAEKLDIQIGNNYIPGQEAKFNIVLYDDQNNKIKGELNYIIQDYYTEIVKEGIANSGEEISFNLSENAIQGPWKITATYNEIKTNKLFNIGELEKAEITLENDVLIVKNIGNTIYEKNILIYIGDNDQTAQIYLEIGQSKKIRLTAPEGVYDVKVIEGNEQNQENVLEFNDVSLTGNVIGLERVLGDGFWKRYPIVGVFLIAVFLVACVVFTLKFINSKSFQKRFKSKTWR